METCEKQEMHISANRSKEFPAFDKESVEAVPHQR